MSVAVGKAGGQKFGGGASISRLDSLRQNRRKVERPRHTLLGNLGRTATKLFSSAAAMTGWLVSSGRGDERFQFFHQVGESFEGQLLGAVTPGLGGIGMNLDEQG